MSVSCQIPSRSRLPPIVRDEIRAVVINAGPERMSSPTVGRLLSRVSELLPTVPVAVMSDYEDPENIQEAFELGVRGYIPTSLASIVAIGALHLVCLGGTFAPTAALLSQGERRQGSAGRAADRGLYPASIADSGLPAPRHGEQTDRV